MDARPEPRRTGTLEVAGQALEFAWMPAASEDASTIVMLHEGLGCVGMWRDFPERVAERTGCGVFAYSRAGYGKSSPVPLPRPLSYMHDEARIVVPAILDAHPWASVILLGHSDGASIAAIHAGATHDPRLRGIILMAPHFFVEQMGLDSIAAAKVAYDEGDLRARLERHHGANVDGAFCGWNDAWLDPKFREWNIEEFLPEIAVPVSIIQGEGDEYGTVAQVDAARRLCRAPLEVHLLADCGHSPQRDQPDQTLDAIAGFVAGLGHGV